MFLFPVATKKKPGSAPKIAYKQKRCWICHIWHHGHLIFFFLSGLFALQRHALMQRQCNNIFFPSLVTFFRDWLTSKLSASRQIFHLQKKCPLPLFEAICVFRVLMFSFPVINVPEIRISQVQWMLQNGVNQSNKTQLRYIIISKDGVFKRFNSEGD